MIVVTGANGQLGKGIVNSLIKRIPPAQVVASVRDVEKATDLGSLGVKVRAGDFSQPQTLAASFQSADQVLIVSVDKLGNDARQMHRNAIEAARDAGAKRILYTSHMGAKPQSAFAAAADHAVAEAVLAEMGIPFTALRHGFYAESAMHLIGKGFETGEIRVPEDGPVSWTARADLADADAAILAGNGSITGTAPPLTASEAVTMADIAAMASELTDRTIKRVVVSDEEWIGSKVAVGVPRGMAELLLGAWIAARNGDFAATDPTLEKLIGRPPQTMRDVLAKVLR